MSMTYDPSRDQNSYGGPMLPGQGDTAAPTPSAASTTSTPPAQSASKSATTSLPVNETPPWQGNSSPSWPIVNPVANPAPSVSTGTPGPSTGGGISSGGASNPAFPGTVAFADGGAVESPDGDTSDDEAPGSVDPITAAINKALETVNQTMMYGRQKHGLAQGGGKPPQAAGGGSNTGSDKGNDGDKDDIPGGATSTPDADQDQDDEEGA